MLKGGMYVLKTSVKNPTPDGRKNSWTAKPDFQKGTRFYLQEGHKDGLCSRLQKLNDYDSLLDYSEGFKALVPHLQPVEPTVAEWMKIERIRASEVLVRLVETGIVTREKVLSIQESLDKEEG